MSRRRRFRQTLIDISTIQTLTIAGSDPTCDPTGRPPAHRATRLTRVWDPAGPSGIQVAPAFPPGDLPDTPIPAQPLPATPLPPLGDDLTATITITRALRHYTDSDGLTFTTELTWADLHLTRSRAHEATQVTDSCTAVTDVPGVVASMAAEVHSRPSGPLRAVPARPVDVLLTPTIAAVLIHELIGHGCEQRPPGSAPERIASSELTVLTEPARPGTHDDDGIPTQTLTLIDAGVTSAPVLDRQSAAQHAGRPSGLSQAALHCGPAMARCTHLRLRPGRPTGHLALHGPGLLCLATSGAEYLDGTAVIAISAARYADDEQGVAPFLLIVDAGDLHRLQVGDDVTYGRSARCVKAGQPLPTRTAAPTMLLPKATVHAR